MVAGWKVAPLLVETWTPVVVTAQIVSSPVSLSAAVRASICPVIFPAVVHVSPVSAETKTLPSGAMPTASVGALFVDLTMAAYWMMGLFGTACQVVPLSVERCTPFSVVANTTVEAGLPASTAGVNVAVEVDQLVPSVLVRN